MTFGNEYRESSAIIGWAEPAIEPAELLGQHVQYGLPRDVAVTLKRQYHHPGRAAVAGDRLEQPLRLDREGTRGGVVGAVHEQDRRADLVRVPERRHPVVDLRHLPVASALCLEAERRQRPVVGSAASDACREEVRMREQVRGHERAVTVAANGNSRWVDDA